jgi:hypothetical protein
MFHEGDKIIQYTKRDNLAITNTHKIKGETRGLKSGTMIMEWKPGVYNEDKTNGKLNVDRWRLENQ